MTRRIQWWSLADDLSTFLIHFCDGNLEKHDWEWVYDFDLDSTNWIIAQKWLATSNDYRYSISFKLSIVVYMGDNIFEFEFKKLHAVYRRNKFYWV